MFAMGKYDGEEGLLELARRVRTLITIMPPGQPLRSLTAALLSVSLDPDEVQRLAESITVADESEEHEAEVAHLIELADLARGAEIEQAQQTFETMAGNKFVHNTQGCRVEFRRDKGYVVVTMRLRFDKSAPLPKDCRGRLAWSAIQGWAAGMVKAANKHRGHA